MKQVEMLPNDDLNPLFLATVQAVEESVVNALIAAKTMKGINDFEVDALSHAAVQQVLRRYNRLVEPAQK
jgi:L-aminopeptidase/D-esterase-like protein